MDENPYRSPTWCEEDLAWEARLAGEVGGPSKKRGTRGVWRWGEVMVVRRRNHALPPACVRSNETDKLGAYLITAVRPGVIWALFIAFLVPGLGLLLALATLGSMRRWGLAADVWLPLRFSTVAACGLLEVAIVGLVLAGNVISAVGLGTGNPTLIGLGFLLPVVGFGVFWLSDRWFVRTALIGSGHVAFHGVHPDYLARLPELPEAEHEVLRRYLH